MELLEAFAKLENWSNLVKLFNRISLSVAPLSLALYLSGSTYAQSNMNPESSQDNGAAQAQASEMVPAQAYLLHKINARNAKVGGHFDAILSESVHLKNGPVLPKGTELIGSVVTDDMQVAGTSKLALRITAARLNNGETIPVKATIVGVFSPQNETAQGIEIAPGEEEANPWSENVLTIDQPNAVSGVDMHSTVDGPNSAEFVSSKKNNVKIAAQSELALAIAGQSEGTAAAGGN